MPEPKERADVQTSQELGATPRGGGAALSAAGRRTMVTARPINVERALVDPRAMFKELVRISMRP
jgi:hypothetical protein